ncbi:unnamed protein product [Didymodactylos carnosus]|uniref:Nucleolus and neural progenitor protein-like N-terminal domain-containing protein n=1 Tax=Didymodactylos carnosus TaxID=1234261 RepID=A0A8S2PTM9_9BILA|nr:unnamed protein product [Didymodactylos carnosus]CAF4067714.1 unnamed protein product [Didymodactylos carnosus]
MTEIKFKITAISYSTSELKQIQPNVDNCLMYLKKLQEHFKSFDSLKLERQLLNRCIYKNWNARHMELGIQTGKRTVKLLERLFQLYSLYVNIEQILSIYKPTDIHIVLPTRDTLNKYMKILYRSKKMMIKIGIISKKCVGHLRLECSRTNFIHYNIVIMALCSRIHYIMLALIQAIEQFLINMKKIVKTFKKKVNKKN